MYWMLQVTMKKTPSNCIKIWLNFYWVQILQARCYILLKFKCQPNIPFLLLILAVPGVWGLCVWVPGRPLGRGGNLQPPFPPGPTPRPSYRMFWRENYRSMDCLQSTLSGERINVHMYNYAGKLCHYDHGFSKSLDTMNFFVSLRKLVNKFL